MPVDIVIVQITAAILLFFLVNWIGHHSLSIGYVQLSAFEANSSQSPALNFLVRFGGPIVFLVLMSTAFFAVGLDRFVENAYLVVLYYFLFRAAFNVLYERSALINWIAETVLASLCVGASYLLYVHLIATKQRLVPNLENVSNELWVIIAVFLYTVVNGIEFSTDAATKRVRRFQKERFLSLQSAYGSIIAEQTNIRDVALLIYAVMVYESFNRPRAVRLIERVASFFGRARTFGVMQVSSESPISDEMSVRLGTQRILSVFDASLERQAIDHPDRSQDWIKNDAIQAAIESYNPDQTYVSEVWAIYTNLLEDPSIESSWVLSDPDQSNQPKSQSILNEEMDLLVQKLRDSQKAVYEKLESTLSEAEKDKLNETQEFWEKYMVSQAEFAAEHFAENSMRPLIYFAEMERLVRHRTSVIANELRVRNIGN